MSSQNPDHALPPGFDVEAVAAAARQKDPSLDAESAMGLAAAAGRHLAEVSPGDAPEIARRCLADFPGLDASWAAVVARAAVESTAGGAPA